MNNSNVGNSNGVIITARPTKENFTADEESFYNKLVEPADLIDKDDLAAVLVCNNEFSLFNFNVIRNSLREDYYRTRRLFFLRLNRH